MKPEQEPMTWGQLLAIANLREEVREKNGEASLCHSLPGGVGLEDRVVLDPPKALKNLREITLISLQIEAIQTSIQAKYPDRCLSCNGRGGRWTHSDEWGFYFDSCDNCVKLRLDPCNTSLKLALSDDLKEGAEFLRAHTSIEEVDVDHLHYALSPTMGRMIGDYHEEWGEMSRLRDRRRRIIREMREPYVIPF